MVKCDGNASQSWRLDGSAIVNVATNESLQAEQGRTDAGTPLVTAPCNGCDAQKWDSFLS